MEKKKVLCWPGDEKKARKIVLGWKVSVSDVCTEVREGTQCKCGYPGELFLLLLLLLHRIMHRTSTHTFFRVNCFQKLRLFKKIESCWTAVVVAARAAVFFPSLCSMTPGVCGLIITFWLAALLLMMVVIALISCSDHTKTTTSTDKYCRSFTRTHTRLNFELCSLLYADTFDVYTFLRHCSYKHNTPSLWWLFLPLYFFLESAVFSAVAHTTAYFPLSLSFCFLIAFIAFLRVILYILFCRLWHVLCKAFCVPAKLFLPRTFSNHTLIKWNIALFLPVSMSEVEWHLLLTLKQAIMFFQHRTTQIRDVFALYFSSSF